jgi:hypothetical protein
MASLTPGVRRNKFQASHSISTIWKPSVLCLEKKLIACPKCGPIPKYGNKYLKHP